MDLTKDQLHTLRHMLGINTPDHKIPKPYRNYAAVNPGDSEFAELERLGVVECYLRANEQNNHYDYFRCTEAGELAAIKSHRNIRLKKSQRVYSRFLDARDSFQDLTFKEFLTDDYWEQARKEA